MRCFRWLSGFAVLAGLQMVAPGEARAQTVKLTEAAITRSTKLRTTSLNPYWTSRADCEANDVYSFPLVLGGFPTDGSVVLQVWAGTAGVDCTGTTTRSTSTQQCWKVAEDYTPSTGFNPVIQVPVRNILTANTTSQSVVTGDANICAKAAGAGTFATSAAQTVTLFFLPVQTTTAVGTGYQYPLKIDLNGPSAPGNVKLGVGENVLILSWNQVTTGDTLGYNFYCDPPPGKEDDNIGGPTGTAGAAGSTTTNTCAGSSGTSSASGAAGAAGTAGVSGSSGSTAAAGTGTTTDTQGYEPSDGGENEDNVGGTTGSAGTNVGTGTGGVAGTDVGTGIGGTAGTDVGTGIGGTAGADTGTGLGGTAGGGGVSGTAGGGGMSGTAGGGGVGIGTGTSGTTGTSGSSSCDTSNSCPSTHLVSGQVLPSSSKYLCGSASGLSATQGTIKGLKNFKQYTVAVAATDSVGNVGPLSVLTCDTPQPIDDFYKTYRDAGGLAGGGYCQASGPLGMSSGGASALGALGAAVVGGWARRRRTGVKR